MACTHSRARIGEGLSFGMYGDDDYYINEHELHNNEYVPVRRQTGNLWLGPFNGMLVCMMPIKLIAGDTLEYERHVYYW